MDIQFFYGHTFNFFYYNFVRCNYIKILILIFIHEIVVIYRFVVTFCQ